jgi:hypothetical protein
MRSAGVCLLALLAGCGSDHEITAVRIVAAYGASAFDQFDFQVGVDGALSDPVTLPKMAAGTLPSPQDVFFYVPDTWAGKTATCRVRGRRSGNVEAIGLPFTVTVELHRAVTCEVLVDTTPDGAVLDGPLPSGGDTGGPPMDAVPFDAGPPADAASPDAVIARDIPPGIEVSPPADSAAPPSDLPVDSPPPPPDTMVPVTGCAGNADRTAFLDLTRFPTIAGCGAPVGYGAAVGAAAGTCAPGWHWCKAEEVGGLPATEPGLVSGSACGWVDGTQGTCDDRRSSYGQAGCAGPATRNLSVGGPSSGPIPCTGIDLACNEPWRLAAAFDRWATSSVSRQSGGCLEHLGFQCASSTGGANCWIVCCKGN